MVGLLLFRAILPCVLGRGTWHINYPQRWHWTLCQVSTLDVCVKYVRFGKNNFPGKIAAFDQSYINTTCRCTCTVHTKQASKCTPIVRCTYGFCTCAVFHTSCLNSIQRKQKGDQRTWRQVCERGLESTFLHTGTTEGVFQCASSTSSKKKTQRWKRDKGGQRECRRQETTSKAYETTSKT